MEYIKLGTSELHVSRVCLGCMGLGNAATGQHSWTVDEAASRDIIRRALDAGINFFAFSLYIFPDSPRSASTSSSAFFRCSTIGASTYG